MRNPCNIERLLKDNYKNYEYLTRFAESSQQYSITESFINLAILKKQVAEDKEKKLKERGGRGEKDSDLGSIVRDERLETYESMHEGKEAIEVEKLFEKREGKDIKKLAIYGRAGIGKTTLCQYIAVKWAKGELWKDKFKAIIWLPLRRIVSDLQQQEQEISLAAVIRQNCMGGRERFKPSEEEINDYLGNFSNVLFILDGYDEIAQVIEDLHNPAGRKVSKLLKEIITEPDSNIVITSRPTSKIRQVGRSQISIDEELENIGFTSENIRSYITKFMPSNKSEEIIRFLESNKGIWGIAHIPINLELICYAWEELARERNYTMSSLYKEICSKLLRRYLAKENNSGLIAQEAEEIDEWEECKEIVSSLEELAIRGMRNNEIVISKSVVREVLGRGVKKVLRTGIIKNIGEDVHFIHLTFQEYFAARYIARSIEEVGSDRYKEAVELIREHKYTPYYEVMWWYVAGTLYDRCSNTKNYTALIRFWHLIETEPRDLIGIKHVGLQIRCLEECEVDERVSMHKNILDNIKQLRFEPLKIKLKYIENISEVLSLSKKVSREIIPLLILISKDKRLSGDKLVSFSCRAIVELGKLGVGNEDMVMPVLLNALKDGRREVMRSAALELGKLGVGHWDKVVPTLLEALIYVYSVDFDIQTFESMRDALCKIGRLEAHKVVPKLSEALKNNYQDKVNSLIIILLGRIGEYNKDKVTPILLEALKSDNKLLRDYVEKALYNMEIVHPALVSIMLKKINFTSILGMVGNFYIDINAVYDHYININEIYDFYKNKIYILSKIAIKYPDTVPIIINDFLKNGNNVAGVILAKIGNRDPSVVPALINALKCCKPISIIAAFGLNSIGIQHLEAASLLKKLPNEIANESNMRNYYKAIEAAIFIEAHPDITIPIMLEFFKKSYNKKFDKIIVDQLIIIGKERQNVIFTLLEALNIDGRHAKRDIFKALGEISKVYVDKIVPALIQDLNARDQEANKDAAKLLGKIGIGREDVIKALIEVLNKKEKHWWVKREAVHALGKVGTEHRDLVIPTLIKALKEKDETVKREAVRALGKVGTEHRDLVIPTLIKALKDGFLKVKSRAAKELGKLGIGHEELVIPPLTKALMDNINWVKRSMAESLAHVVIGQEEKIVHIIVNNVTSSEDITIVSKMDVLSIINLYCFKYSSNPLWLENSLAYLLQNNSYATFKGATLIIKDLGRVHEIEFTEFQKKTLLEKFKESAQERGLSTEVYDYYLGQGTLGFRNEVGIIEKTELHKAAEIGDLRAVKAILAQGKIDINDQSNQYRETPLMLAAQNGHWDIVGFLVKNNAEINCFNLSVGGERKSVIGILTNIYEKHEYYLDCYNRVNQLLMSARAVPFNDNVQDMSEDRKQMFLKALDEDSLNQLDVVLRNGNRDINYYLDEDHTTLLMYAVKTRASNNIINKLIQSGASLTQLNKSNQNVFAICAREIAKLTGAMSKDNIKGCLNFLIRERKPINEVKLNQAIEKLLSARLSGNNSDEILDKVVSELTGCSSIVQYLNDNELRDIYRLHLGNILSIGREHRGETKVEGNDATILLSMRIYLYIKLLLEIEQGKETKYIKPAQLRREILTTLETLSNERVRDLIDSIEISNELRQVQGLNIIEQIKNLKVGEEYSCQSGYQIGEIQSGHCLYVSFVKIDENKIAIRIDNRWVKVGRVDGVLHGTEPWSKRGEDNIPKIKSYLVGVAYLNDGREVEKLKRYIEKVMQAISTTMSRADTAISYIYKAKITQISNQSEIERLTGDWTYHDRQSDGNANCTMSSHNLGVSVRNGRDAFIELCNYEKSEIWIDVETQYLEQKSPVISNTRLRGESTSLSWSERIRPTEDKESKEGEVSVVSNASSFSHTTLMKKFQSVLGCSWNDVYSGIVVEQALVEMAGINTIQTDAQYRPSITNGIITTTFKLRFTNRQELTEFTNYYNRKFPGLLIDKSLEFQADSLIEINMDTSVLHNEVAISLGEYVARNRTQEISPRVDNSRIEESGCYLS